MLRKIILHGKLKELYQDDIELDAESVGEIVRALVYQINGFKELIEAGSYMVCLGEDKASASIDESLFTFRLGKTDTVHIVPALEGDKGGAGKIIIGVALVAAAFFTGGVALTASGAFVTGGAAAGVGSAAIAAGVGVAGISISASTLGLLGASLILGGVSSLLTPSVKNPNSNSSFQQTAENPSFLFSGPTNVNQQGIPVPIIYGIMLVGSIVVSVGLTSEKKTS